MMSRKVLSNIFKEIHIDSTTREELIEALHRFYKTAIPKLMSPKGKEYLKQRYGNFNQQKYLSDLLNTKERVRLRINKLENNQMFSSKFIEDLQLIFENMFIDINALRNMYDDKEFCEEQNKQFEKFKIIYRKLYPNSIFDFDAFQNDKSPYHRYPKNSYENV